MKKAASARASATATAVSTANDSGRARITRPSHALARAASDSARKSDMVFLGHFGFFAAVARHPDVEQQEDGDGECAEDLEPPRLHVPGVFEVPGERRASQD